MAPVEVPGISHWPPRQMPLAQSAPTEQLVFGSIPPDSQTPFVHLVLAHSLLCEQDEPGRLPAEDESPGWHTPFEQTWLAHSTALVQLFPLRTLAPPPAVLELQPSATAATAAAVKSSAKIFTRL